MAPSITLHGRQAQRTRLIRSAGSPYVGVNQGVQLEALDEPRFLADWANQTGKMISLAFPDRSHVAHCGAKMEREGLEFFRMTTEPAKGPIRSVVLRHGRADVAHPNF